MFEHGAKSVSLQDNTTQHQQDSTDHTKRLEYFQQRSSYYRDLVPRAARKNSPLPDERQPDTASRLLAKLLREVLASDSFESLADLTDALKRRCGRLHVRWTNDAISNAFRLVGSNRALVTRRPTVAVAAPAPSRELTRREAAAIWAKVVGHFGAGTFRSLPAGRVNRLAIDGPITDVVDVESLVTGGRA